MAARQIDPEDRQARRQRVDELIGKLRAGIAQRALFDEGSLDGFDIDNLQYELDGMKRHLSRKLPRTTALFSDNDDLSRELLAEWSKELKQLRVDRIAEKAVKIHFLILKARAVLPEIEAARQEHWAREAAEREAAFQARVAEARAAGTLREFTGLGCRSEVRRLVEKHTGETYYDWNSASALFGDALRLGVITDLEYEVAKRAYGRGWSYAGD